MSERDKKKVVIQLSSDDPEVHKALIEQIANLRKALPESQIELVVHSKGISFVLAANHWRKPIESMMEYGVTLLVCQNTMVSHHLHPADILSSAQIIPSAVAHLVIRQSEGWSYLKAGF